MAATEPHPDAPEFAGVRADLARLYIAHMADLDLWWTEQEIVASVDDITAALIGCAMHATKRGDVEWLDRHQWFSDACDRLFKDKAAVALDG